MEFLECSGRDEADLLREFFDLMRKRTELRRYEKELLVHAQEVQLEDRHERLEQELQERLADDGGFSKFSLIPLCRVILWGSRIYQITPFFTFIDFNSHR